MEIIKNAKLILCLIFVIMFIALNCISVYAATLKTIPDETYKTSTEDLLKLNNENCSVTWRNGINGKTAYYGTRILFCVPIKDTDKSWSYSNFMTVHFDDIGTINGRSMDADVDITKLTVSARKGSKTGENSDGYMAVATVTDIALVFGSTIGTEHGYRAQKNIDYTVTIKWADTGEVVNYPFFQSVIDIDAGASYYAEAWEGKTGYSGIYYKYKDNFNIFDGNKVTSPILGETDGDEEWYKAGVYAPTSSGTFSGTFTEGNSGTGLLIHSSYTSTPELFVQPVETVNKTRVKEGNEYTYSVHHTMGIFFKNQMTTYGMLVFTAVMPDEVDYKEGTAKMLDSDGNDITTLGDLEYDEKSRTITFKMGKDWLEDISNYDGQEISLNFDVIAKDIQNEKEIDVYHKSTVQYEDVLIVDTNKVKVTVYQDIKIQLIKKLKISTLDFIEEHGNPTFIFKVSGDKNWYKSITFTNETIEMLLSNSSDKVKEYNGWKISRDNDYIVAKSEIFTLPYDDYDVDEIGTIRYIQTNKNVEWHSDTQIYEFYNEKVNFSYFSDNDLVINQLTN